MVQSITIKNFKSIADETIELGRVNVLIGENGCGKSNILEAIAFLSASLVTPQKVDKDILFGKGVRLAKPSLMVTSERGKKPKEEISIVAVLLNENIYNISVNAKINNTTIGIEDFQVNRKMESHVSREMHEAFLLLMDENLKKNMISDDEIKKLKEESGKNIKKRIRELLKIFNDEDNREHLDFSQFLIYTLNTIVLRGLASASHQAPVGIYGENLDVLIANFDNEERNQLKEYFYLIDWLENYILDTEDALKLRGFKQNLSTSRLYFEDKYMRKSGNNHIFSSENANEGILHLFFYLAVMISKKTPAFFAIDNIESCLNPHLCRRLMTEICVLAEKNNKQVIVTTHNPAILDGLNLHDDNIRLFEVKRDDRGLTKIRRIKVKPTSPNGKKYKLSELWTNGYLGAIPEHF